MSLTPKKAKSKFWEKDRVSGPAPGDLELRNSNNPNMPKISLKDKIEGKTSESSSSLPEFTWDENKSVGQNMAAMMNNKQDYYEQQKERERKKKLVQGIGSGLKTLVAAGGAIDRKSVV